MVLVAPSISSTSERAGKASCGVGGARSIDDAKDSTTLAVREGALLVCTTVPEFKDEPILHNKE